MHRPLRFKAQHLVPALLDWYLKSARDLPWRRTRDPYAIWVSEIMLQQTQVKTVIPYFDRWMRELPTIASLAKAPPEKIHKLWEGLGYYTRVRNMQRAAQMIVEKHEGKFPGAFDDVLALPGIGRYTAGAICSIAFDQPKPILDGNVIRVLTRVFGISEDPKEKKTNERLWTLAAELVSRAEDLKRETEKDSFLPAEIWNALQTLTPTPHLNPLPRGERRPDSHVSTDKNRNDNAKSPVAHSRTLSRFPATAGKQGSVGFASAHAFPRCSFLNQSLMELGALICTPRQPKCDLCPLRKSCVALNTNRIEELPNLGARVAATQRRFVAFIVERGGKFFVQQRPAKVVNAHLWEFPNVEVGIKDKWEKIKRDFCGMNAELQPICCIKHSITRYRITLDAVRVAETTIVFGAGQWLEQTHIKNLAFTAAHRKIAEIVCGAPRRRSG